MKYAVSSYSYSQLTNRGEYTELQLPALAKEMGFDYIEFAEIHTPEGRNKADYAAELREACEKAGVPAVCYSIGANFSRTGDEQKKEIERVRGEVDIAATLGCKLMRHDVTYGLSDEDKARHLGFDQILPRLIEGCTAVTEYAGTKGVRTMTENHGFFCQESLRVEKLVTGVAHPNYGLLLDAGNFLCADEDPALAFARLAPYALHLHAKDFHIKSGNGAAPQGGFFTSRAGNFLRGAIIGHGDAPVLQCLRILKSAGYKGCATVEFEGMEDAKTGVRLGLDNLKYLSELAGF